MTDRAAGPRRGSGPRRTSTGTAIRAASRVAGALGLMGLGAFAAAGRARRDLQLREAGWRDRLHHRVLPSLHAAERALVDGDTDAAVDQVRCATHTARQTVDAPVGGPDPVGEAIAAARRTWGAALAVDDAAATGLPRGVTGPVGDALGAITLEALNNVARHQPGATAQVVVTVDPDRIALSIAARNPWMRDADTAAAPAGVGYGVAAMRRAATDAGGRLEHHLDAASTLVLATFPRPRWRSRLPTRLRARIGR